MSQPREVIPGATYLITRRALRRHLLLRPDPTINQLIVYTLAVAAGRHGIQVHAFCTMSTHLHLVVTDVRGVLPRFLQLFHRLVALGAKVLRAWEGPLWDHESTSAVRLLTRASVVEKTAYVLANPVAAGLVQHACDWPGAKVRVDELGRGSLRAKRPLVYFDPTNPEWPAEATLPLTLPPAVLPHGAAGFRREVEGELARQEAVFSGALLVIHFRRNRDPPKRRATARWWITIATWQRRASAVARRASPRARTPQKALRPAPRALARP